MSATKKQTAVEWLVEQIQLGKIEIIYSNEIHSIKCIPNIIEQAKAMEKEQIMDAFEQQVIQWAPEILEDGTLRVSNILKSAEQYYNETYETI